MWLYNQRLPAALARLILHPAYGSWRIKQHGVAPSVAQRHETVSQDPKSRTAEEEINIITRTLSATENRFIFLKKLTRPCAAHVQESSCYDAGRRKKSVFDFSQCFGSLLVGRVRQTGSLIEPWVDSTTDHL